MYKNIIDYHRYHDSHGRSYYGVDQIAISAKIDSRNMKAMEAEMTATGVKRNRLINLAVKWYLKELDDARRKACEDLSTKKYILNVDTSSLSVGELEKLEFICRGLGCTKEKFAQHVLSVALMDYEKNPYHYMP